MNQHTFHVDSQGGTVNFTINNVCNIIVAPTTFVSSSFRRPQEDPSTYNNHQNEGATKSREHEQNDNGDAPNRTTNATTLPEGHSYELPPPRENRSPPNVIILPYLVDNEQQDVIPVEHRLLPSNNPLSVATQGEISDAEGRNAEDLRGPDGSTQTVQISEVQTPVDETADAGGAQFGVVQSTDARIAKMSMNDAILTDVEMDDTPLAETLITDDETAAAQTEEVQTADAVAAETAETQTSAADIVLIDVTESAAAAGIANTQTAAAETSDTQSPLRFLVRTVKGGRRQMMDCVHRRPEVSTAQMCSSIRYRRSQKTVTTVSNAMTEKMPVCQNRCMQHFKVKNRSERRTMNKECNKLEWKQKWALSEIIKDTATPFFAHHITLDLPLRFIMYTTKYLTKESYKKVLGNSQYKNHVKSCLVDESFFNEIEKNLNEKGRKDFHDIIRTTINHFERDAATAVGLGNRFLQSK
ncbi:hypothetical protein GCK72_021647 [Caenorhabditis remanei]|uniref:Uncharacterized protein n=1 Tax=Caenorhabditis remanei TaxID=31234 RepID=A0A6A5GLD0_CAERE|nr:hypothetical protein GCK72_021647 [Caenorhabditis remanei]KAF1755079.1 hypothetical protein GCK72_021647 [Caenorhabditis remanei]